VSAPERPLTIAYASLSKARHLDTIGVQPVAEIEALYLNLMLTGLDASTDVLMLADGGKGGFILDPAQHVRYTCLDHEVSPRGPGLGVLPTPPGPSLYDTVILSTSGCNVNEM
jgi:hypothetical protein